MYQNPAFEDTEGLPTSTVSCVSGVYISSEALTDPPARKELLPGELRRSLKCSAGEKMMISITGDQEDFACFDRLMIPVRGDVREQKSEQEQFDPDTLEREDRDHIVRNRHADGKSAIQS